MAYMHLLTHTGRLIRLNSRQYGEIAAELHDGQIAEQRFEEKDTPYRRYRTTRLATTVPPTPFGYSIAVCRSARNDLDHVDPPLFAKLDRVILALSEQPEPPGCIRLRWLRSELRILRVPLPPCLVTYAIDAAAKRVRVLRVSFWGKKPTPRQKSRTGQATGRPAASPPGKHPSLIDRDWQDGYCGETTEELIALDKHGQPERLIANFTEALREKVERGRRLRAAERVVLAVGTLDSTMVCEGFGHFFEYSPHFVPAIVDSLRLIGCKRLANATERALGALHLRKITAAQLRTAMQKPDEGRDRMLWKCSNSYWRSPGPARRLFAFIKANRHDIQL